MRILRLGLAAGALIAAPLGLGVSPAGASPPATDTYHAHHVEDTFVDRFPSCETGAKYIITTVSNLVAHVTAFDDGREHVTFTVTGSFEATPKNDPSLPDASGRFTEWGGFNANGDTVNGTHTFSVRGSTEDGEQINLHVTDHFNQRPDGTVNEFLHCQD
jgi:hypothetical protein